MLKIKFTTECSIQLSPFVLKLVKRGKYAGELGCTN